MRNLLFGITSILVLAASIASPRISHDIVRSSAPILWHRPVNMATLDLFYGLGGRQGQPCPPFTFLKEDLSGTNPKIDVVDADEVHWKVKIGIEARPETAASRLLWAAGYFTAEDYYLPEMKVENLPATLVRGQKFFASDGTVHNVRLKRAPDGTRKSGSWTWRENPFFGTREFNGLRVMMALMNNWDLKDANNTLYQMKHTPEELYAITDLGSTFGTTGLSWKLAISKGDLESYRRSRFIRRLGPEFVDFNVPTRPNLFVMLRPKLFMSMSGMRWIGMRIPRADARWIGDVLSRLSPEQIRQAFLGAGYAPDEAQGFTDVVLQRIAQLKAL